MKTLSIQRPRPSIEMRMSASFKVLVKAKPVNCEQGRLPCDDGVQSADRRARNRGEAAGAPPITPAKSGYSAASKAHPSPNSVQTSCDTWFADR